MLNEKSGGEWSWAGLGANSFTDGKYEKIPLTRWLEVDFDQTRAPNHPQQLKP